jgi:hypothetical protein
MCEAKLLTKSTCSWSASFNSFIICSSSGDCAFSALAHKSLIRSGGGLKFMHCPNLMVIVAAANWRPNPGILVNHRAEFRIRLLCVPALGCFGARHSQATGRSSARGECKGSSVCADICHLLETVQSSKRQTHRRQTSTLASLLDNQEPIFPCKVKNESVGWSCAPGSRVSRTPMWYWPSQNS